MLGKKTEKKIDISTNAIGRIDLKSEYFGYLFGTNEQTSNSRAQESITHRVDPMQLLVCLIQRNNLYLGT